MQPGVLVHPVRMGNAMLRTSRCSVPKGGVSSSLGTKSHCIPPFGLRKGWSNRLPMPANPFAKGLRGQDVFGHFSVCLEAISFLSFITRHQQPLPGGCCVPCPTATHLPAKPSRHFSSLLQDVKSHQGFPALYPRIDAAPVESQPGTPHDAQQHSLPARCALPDVAARCANPPHCPFSCSGSVFWLQAGGKWREEVGKWMRLRGRLRFLPHKPAQ